ncbi:Aminopyrrolnitrin oxygenase PrnD [Enhygromyxa salina]|uniref:Aminopyrrolnitrin oxygenase PrnD n=2 Tax=Enhygromyxa salina TaxID=215803 RepID=A0A2S9YN21_9BACT|nr:Aminopyrrolnitrin oxygenase PrnD [Enhygromyxa salina]
MKLRGSPVKVKVLDHDMVVFRDARGRPSALLDRCSHRGAPLSIGRVVRGAVECSYHGWRYDRSGECIHIPSLTKERRIPKSCTVPSFPCAENDGYVWVWTGEGEPAPLPAIAGFSSRYWVQGMVEAQCASLRAVEINLDWCHPYFAHRWTHPQSYRIRVKGFSEGRYETRATSSGMILFAPPTKTDDAPVPAEPGIKLTYELPDRVSVEFFRPYHTRAVMHFVPTGPSSCRLEYVRTRSLPIGRRIRWESREPLLFAQDRTLLEGGQPWYDRDGGQFERSVEADWSTIMVRQIVEQAASGQWPPTELPRRRVISVRG